MDQLEKIPFPIPRTVKTVETLPLSIFLTMVIIICLQKSLDPLDIFLILV